eukprot:m.110342 g.110342  ORF g.110342 m.110342 type:complete len:739 (-) comp15914_c1_seq1:710-2926(-)
MSITDEAQRPLHIVSWNVASWPTALKAILRFNPSLESWLERHNIDILCMQEVKVIERKIAEEPKTLGALSEHYDTFWSSCTVQEKRGFNGVATFARKGLTACANSAPLNDAALDAEGRCIFTDHGSFVIFNVYVPNDGPDSCRLPLKMRFLRALRKSMAAARQQGKTVLLAGDLNISRRPLDVFPDWRRLDIDNLLSDRGFETEENSLLRIVRRDMRSFWPRITERLAAATPKEQTIPNGATRFKLAATPLDGSAPVLLGDVCESASEARWSFQSEGYSVTDEASGEVFVVKRNNRMCVKRVVECMVKLANIVWTKQTVRELQNVMGEQYSSPPCIEWFDSLLNEDKMIDSFVHFYPTAEGRYTCWDQYRNRRYENEGSRIDYIVVDGASSANLVRGPPLYVAQGVPRRVSLATTATSTTEAAASTTVSLSEEAEPSESVTTPTEPSSSIDKQQQQAAGPRQSSVDVTSAAAALTAATGGGHWRPAPFDGSGLNVGTRMDDEAQFYVPHTGMLYTPPVYSDHIAVSLLFLRPKSNSSSSSDDCVTLASDKVTRRAQPHLKQPSIRTFFSAPAAAASSNNNSSSASNSSSSLAAKVETLSSTITAMASSTTIASSSANSVTTTTTKSASSFFSATSSRTLPSSSSAAVVAAAGSSRDGEAAEDASEAKTASPYFAAPSSSGNTSSASSSSSAAKRPKPSAASSSSSSSKLAAKVGKAKSLPVSQQTLLQMFQPSSKPPT